MAGNTIGQLFRVTTFGESHGLALGCIVDGVPPGIPLTEADLHMTSTVVALDIALYHPAPRAGSGQNSLRCF